MDSLNIFNIESLFLQDVLYLIYISHYDEVFKKLYIVETLNAYFPK